MNPSKINSDTYSDPKVIDHYSDYSKTLQAPERAILETLDGRLSQMKMLDIGVGGGRTSLFFAPLVKEYTAIDFAEGMIDACKKKFLKQFPNAVFKTKDVRDLKDFSSGSFDLVLFSFNGLDNISHEERLAALKEIRRICKPEGYFCFSSHNLLNLPEFFSIRFRLHPLKFLKSVLNRRKLIEENQAQIKQIPSADHLIIYDNVYDFGLFTYYSRPSYQIKQLKDAGFPMIRLFSLNTGKEFSISDTSNYKNEPWIYYLCQ